MSELKKYPTSFEKSKGVISEPSNFYRGDSVTLNTTHGELIVIASDANAIRYASQCMMPSNFKVDISRAEDVAVFSHSKVTKQDSPQGKWISVSDRLPDNFKEVITNVNGGLVKANRFSPSNNAWFDYDDSVTHWMPLPEPPKC